MGVLGDSYDRFLVRVEEMRQSLAIITQCLSLIPEGLVRCEDDKLAYCSKGEIDDSMEQLINYFKFHATGLVAPQATVYTSAETPKGEFGVFLVTDDSNVPYRCKIRSPGFYHLQGLRFLGKNKLLSDIVVLIGTIDIVFGEIDR